MKSTLDKRDICKVQLDILEETIKSEKESRQLKKEKDELTTHIKKILSEKKESNFKEILTQKNKEIKEVETKLQLLNHRRELLRRIVDSLVWQIFGRNTVLNTQREVVDFISDKEGLEAEIEFFKQISSKVSGIPVPIFNDLSHCLSIADISVVTLEKDKFSFDFYEIKKTETGKFTPRHIKQAKRGEQITIFLQEGRGKDIGGFKNKIIYSTSVTAKYFYGDIQDLLYKCKKFGIAKRIKDKCIFYVAYDNSKYSFEQILEKYFIPYFKIGGSNGQIGSIETNIRDHFVKPIFLFEMDRRLIFDLIFERITLMVFFNYDYLNKLTKDRKISFLLNNDELFAFLKKDPSKKFNVRGSNYSEVIHGGLSAISFVDYTEEVIPYFDDLMRGLTKDHPLSPYDPREKFGYRVVSGNIVDEKK